MIYAVQETVYDYDSTSATALVSWLASNGTDFHTPNLDAPYPYILYIPISPASGILDSFSQIPSSWDETFTARRYYSLYTILPYLVSRSCNNLITWSSNKSRGWSVVSGWISEWTPGEIFVQMNSSKLLYLVMEENEQGIPYRSERK